MVLDVLCGEGEGPGGPCAVCYCTFVQCMGVPHIYDAPRLLKEIRDFRKKTLTLAGGSVYSWVEQE